MKLQPDRMRAIPRTSRRRGDIAKEQLRLVMLAEFGVERVHLEHRFHPVRRWRFDYAVPDLKLAVEYEGHGQSGRSGHVGGHASLTGMAGDAEKYNQAQALGWTVLRFTALHFDPKAREKHKLSSPAETIVEAGRRKR